MADGQHIEVAKAYVTIVPSMEGSQKTIKTEMGLAVEPAAKEVGEKSGKTLGSSMGKGLKAAGKVIGAAMAAVSAAAVASTKAFMNTAKQVSEYGDTVDKSSQKVGLSARKWQEYDYVLKIAGSDMSSITVGLKTLTNHVDKAKNGNKEAVAAFKSLGISLKDLKKMSREKIFEKTIAQLQKMPESSKRAALANKVLGRSGQELTPLFNMTNKETQELINKAHDLGMVMSDEGVKASAAYQDSLTTLSGTIQGVKNNIMTQFMPGLTAMTEGLANVLGGKGASKLKEGIALFMVELRRIGPDVMSTISEVGVAAIQGLGPMLPSLVSTIFTLLTQAIVTVSGMIPQLMPSIISGIQGALAAVMQALPIIIDGLTQLTMALVTWLSSEGNVFKLVEGIVALTVQLANSISMVLPVLIPALVEIVSQLALALTEERNVKALVDAALTLVGSIAVAIGKGLAKIPALVGNLFVNLVNLMASFLEWAVPKAAAGVEAIVNTVKKWGASLLSGIKTWIFNVSGKMGELVALIVDRIKVLPEKALSIGRALVSGIWEGIFKKLNWLKDRIDSFGKGIINKVRSVFQVHSPSKVFAEIGSFLAEGLGVGWEDTLPEVRTDMAKSLNGLTGNMNATVTANGSAGALTENNTTFNGSPITVIVNAAEGQSVNAIADAVIDKISNMTTRKGAVYA